MASKFAVVGTNAKAIGFTGGLDFSNERWAHPMHPTVGEVWHDVMARLEERVIRRCLEEHGGNRTRAAETLGISRQALQAKLAKWREAEPA